MNSGAGMGHTKYMHFECWLTILSLVQYILNEDCVIGMLLTEYMLSLGLFGVRFRFRFSINISFRVKFRWLMNSGLELTLGMDEALVLCLGVGDFRNSGTQDYN